MVQRFAWIGQTLLETEPVALKNWGILFLLALPIFPVIGTAQMGLEHPASTACLA